MQMYKDYKSPLGYEIGDDGIDSYGVNHNGFSARDEVEYQMARNQREQQLMQDYNNQGITENYPQYGTDFWGDNAYNNYGFGTSDISSNIDGVTSQLNNQGMSYNSQYSSIGQPYNSVPPQTPMPWSNNYGYGYNQYQNDSHIFGDNRLGFPNRSTYLGEGLYLEPDTLTAQGIQYAQNNINSTVSDADNSPQVDYSLYGTDFTKEFIDKMLNDAEFQKILNEYIIPNEGGYSNRLNDRGKKTNYGISQKTYYNEDIPNLTRERANAIIYRDFYDWNGLNKLPYPIRGFVVDYGMPTSPLNAIQTVHKVIGLPPNGNIIGKDTLGKLENYTEDDYNNFLNNYRKEMYKYYYDLVEKDATQKENLRGWLNRADRAHLAR